MRVVPKSKPPEPGADPVNKIVMVILAGFVLAALAPALTKLLHALVLAVVVIGGLVVALKLINYYTRF
jgi:hypothetical protein